MVNVSLSDQFDETRGRLPNYDAYSETDRLRIIDQKHVDIRSFNNDPQQTEWRMLDLNRKTVGYLNTQTVGQLAGARTQIVGEQWTQGTAERMTDRRNWYGLSLTCPPLIQSTTQSVIPLSDGLTGVEVVDLLTDFEDDDFISLALPAFPLAQINTTQSWMDLTSHPAGDFTVGPTVSLRLADSTIPLVAGDSEYRRLRSSIVGIDIQQITGVRFRIEANTSCTFRAAALRLISKAWNYTQLDLDTRLGVMKPTVAPNGSLTRLYDFEFPLLFRAAEPAGTGDPKPIDMSVSVAFNPGTKNGLNNIRLHFREGPGDFTTQLDLNGKTMAQLDGLPQPNITTETYKGRTQLELDRFTQTDLLGDTMTEIGRTVDPEIASYLTAFLQWGPASTSLSLIDSEGNGHTFPGIDPLLANTPHILIAELVDKTMRARIYPMDLSGNILVKNMVFDTSIVDDEFVFVRRAGRFGWTALLGDGDAYIDNISTRRQVYGELQTAAYGSLTPVMGAELHVSSSTQLEFFEQLSVANFINTNVTIARDRTRSTTGRSYRVDNRGVIAPQGVVTNLADFYDFDEMEISFDLYYPGAALKAGVGLDAYLSNNSGRIIPVPLGKILPDRWQTFKLSPGGKAAQTGRYSFFLIQSTVGAPSTWWIDNIHIRERTMSFYARSVAADPWGDTDADWVPFKNQINKGGSGVQFLERGRALQVLARGHRQSAYVDNMKVIPQYAQLGNFVWEEDELYNPQGPTAFFTAVPNISPNGRTVVFNGTGSSDPDGTVINYRWNFGDGESATGPVVTHTYRVAGSYSPSLVVIDSNGLQDSASETMFVTPG